VRNGRHWSFVIGHLTKGREQPTAGNREQGTDHGEQKTRQRRAVSWPVARRSRLVARGFLNSRGEGTAKMAVGGQRPGIGQRPRTWNGEPARGGQHAPGIAPASSSGPSAGQHGPSIKVYVTGTRPELAPELEVPIRLLTMVVVCKTLPSSNGFGKSIRHCRLPWTSGCVGSGPARKPPPWVGAA